MTRQLPILALIISVLSGCGLSTDRTTAIFSDDFSNPDSGWSVWSDEKSSAEYKNGEYIFGFYQYDTSSWAWIDELSDLSDVEVQFTVRNPEESPFFRFGIYCDYQDEGNSYSLLVSTNGFYRITKLVDGVKTILTPMVEGADEWAFSEEIPVQSASYDFAAVCADGTLSLSVNGNRIAQINDTAHSRGGIRLRGGYYGHETGKIYFDDFTVTQK